MATKPIVGVPTPFRRIVGYNWLLLLNGDNGAPLQMSAWQDRTVQITGTFGIAGTIVIEGSNDGVNYKTLRDPGGTALSFTAADLKAILELPKWIRPRVTGGDGTTSLNVYINGRGDTH